LYCYFPAVEILRKRRMTLQQVIDVEEAKRTKLMEEIKKATEDAEKCSDRIRDLANARDKLDSTISQTEGAFDKVR